MPDQRIRSEKGLASLGTFEAHLVPETGGARSHARGWRLTRSGFSCMSSNSSPGALPDLAVAALKLASPEGRILLARCEMSGPDEAGGVRYRFTHLTGTFQAYVLQEIAGSSRRVLNGLAARGFLWEWPRERQVNLLSAAIPIFIGPAPVEGIELPGTGLLLIRHGIVQIEVPGRLAQSLRAGDLLAWAGIGPPPEKLRARGECRSMGFFIGPRIGAAGETPPEGSDPALTAFLDDLRRSVGRAGIVRHPGFLPAAAGPAETERETDAYGLKIAWASSESWKQDAEVLAMRPPASVLKAEPLDNHELREALFWLQKITHAFGIQGRLPSARPRTPERRRSPLWLGTDPDEIRSFLLATAIWAQDVACRVRHPAPGHLALLGLLHEVGLLVLLSENRELMGEVHRFSTQAKLDPMIVEAAAFEKDHAQLGYELAVRWGLESTLARAIFHHHSPDPAAGRSREAALIGIAQALACRTLGIDGVGYHPPQPIVSLLVGAGITKEGLASLLKGAADVQARVRTILGTDSPRRAA